LFHVFMIIGF